MTGPGPPGPGPVRCVATGSDPRAREVCAGVAGDPGRSPEGAGRAPVRFAAERAAKPGSVVRPEVFRRALLIARPPAGPRTRRTPVSGQDHRPCGV